jgi:hypothetical protein
MDVREIPVPARGDEDVPTGGLGGVVAAELTPGHPRELVVTSAGVVSAHAVDGTALWRREDEVAVSQKSEDNGLPGHQAPGVQVADVDDDGADEVCYLTRENDLVVVDGETGTERRRERLPTPDSATGVWEHLVVADLRGAGDRDLLLQTSHDVGDEFDYLRGTQVRATTLADPGAVRWEHDDVYAASHNGVRVADLDGDGRDEVLPGGEVIGPDGERLTAAPGRHDVVCPHVDAVTAAPVDPATDPGAWQAVAIEETGFSEDLGRDRVFVLDEQELRWASYHPDRDERAREPQNVAVGNFDDTRPGLEIWCRSRLPEHQRPYVLDAHGRVVADYAFDERAPESWTVEGVETMAPIHWTGEPTQLVAGKERHVAGDVGLFDPLSGAFRRHVDETAERLYVADVLGDWREELVVRRPDRLVVYANDAENPRPDRERLWAARNYRRLKTTWNYYST